MGNLYLKNDEEGLVLAGLNILWLVMGAGFYILTYALTRIAGYTLFIANADRFSWMNWLALITICASWLYLAYTIAKQRK